MLLLPLNWLRYMFICIGFTLLLILPIDERLFTSLTAGVTLLLQSLLNCGRRGT